MSSKTDPIARKMICDGDKPSQDLAVFSLVEEGLRKGVKYDVEYLRMVGGYRVVGGAGWRTYHDDLIHCVLEIKPPWLAALKDLTK